VGYLLLEHTHANPVLVTFCQLLIKTMNEEQEEINVLKNHLTGEQACASK